MKKIPFFKQKADQTDGSLDRANELNTFFNRSFSVLQFSTVRIVFFDFSSAFHPVSPVYGVRNSRRHRWMPPQSPSLLTP